MKNEEEVINYKYNYDDKLDNGNSPSGGGVIYGSLGSMDESDTVVNNNMIIQSEDFEEQGSQQKSTKITANGNNSSSDDTIDKTTAQVDSSSGSYVRYSSSWNIDDDSSESDIES